MVCQRCKSERILHINGKCSDLSYGASSGEHEQNGSVPTDIGLLDKYGDYVELRYCLNCGQIQGHFPVDTTRLEREE